jgi:hypothetical protein
MNMRLTLAAALTVVVLSGCAVMRGQESVGAYVLTKDASL